MTQEDKDLKQLLLKDLCARLPYGVIIKTHDGNGHLNSIDQTIFGVELGVNVSPVNRKNYSLEEVKPYLFPISSITDRQYDIMYGITENDRHDWLNANHFDYRGLIEKGLAIDATGLNIY